MVGTSDIAEILRPIWVRYRAIKYRRRRGKQAGARIGVRRRLLQRVSISPDGPAGNNAQIDASGILIREVDLMKPVDTLPEKTRVFVWRQESFVAVKKFWSDGVDVYSAVSLDVERALDVQYVHCVVPSAVHCCREIRNAHAYQCVVPK